jgi:hypothetical protein
VPTSLRCHFGWALCVALSLAPAAAAQTRFTWPDTTVDVSKYATVEECLAAVRRDSLGQVALKDQIAPRDTMPSDPQEPLKPLPVSVTQVATRCAARFDAKAAKVADYNLLMQLFLLAGRDADAKTMLERRLAAVAPKNTHERIAVEDSAVDVYLIVHPRRLDAAEQLLVSRARSGVDRLDRLALYYRLMDAARMAGDTTRSRRAAQWIIAVGDSITPTERESDKYTKLGPNGGDLVMFAAMQEMIGVKTLVDSLRHSTMAMVGVMRTMWAHFTHQRAEALPLPIGEHAPQLAGDFWFPREAANEKHPAPGHVSIVEFIDASPIYAGCIGKNTWDITTDACTFSFAFIRRLSQRFPGLDVTYVIGTRGHFIPASPPSPGEEAEYYNKWIDAYHIRGAVVSVTSRTPWTLPPPDNRRIDKPTPNAVAYSFGKIWQVEGAGFGGRYLVDQDGIIVDVFFNEQASNQFIDALMHRQQAGGERAEK